MTCRMLLGRKALENDFLVDSSKTHLSRPNWKLKVAASANKVAETEDKKQ